jgi:hypothetical protein
VNTGRARAAERRRSGGDDHGTTRRLAHRSPQTVGARMGTQRGATCTRVAVTPGPALQPRIISEWRGWSESTLRRARPGHVALCRQTSMIQT